MPSQDFDVLFTKTRPHILEIICLSLDYETLWNCAKVNKAWKGVLKSSTFQLRAKSVFQGEIQQYGMKLLVASTDGDTEEVRRLLSKDMLGLNSAVAHPRHEQQMALNIVQFRRGHKDVLDLLLRRVHDGPKNEGWMAFPLFIAAYNGHKDIVQLLLENGAGVDDTVAAGCTPLHGAAYSGHKAVARLLLDWRADPTVANVEGDTPLSCADTHNDKYIVKMLISRINDPAVDLMTKSVCSICYVVPHGMVLQCPSGHLTCRGCSRRTATCSMCPKQYEPDVHKWIRNLAVEKTFEEAQETIEEAKMSATCKNGKCLFSGPKKELLSHSETCLFRSVACPFSKASETTALPSIMVADLYFSRGCDMMPLDKVADHLRDNCQAVSNSKMKSEVFGADDVKIVVDNPHCRGGFVIRIQKGALSLLMWRPYTKEHIQTTLVHHDMGSKYRAEVGVGEERIAAGDDDDDDDWIFFELDTLDKNLLDSSEGRLELMQTCISLEIIETRDGAQDAIKTNGGQRHPLLDCQPGLPENDQDDNPFKRMICSGRFPLTFKGYNTLM